MYQLEVQENGVETLYHQAMDALLKGQLAKASRDLQAVLLQCPEHPHAARLLRRVSALDPTRHGIESLID
jgi:outer membrane protein assembly factor BamD (BamD/ComL family)